MTLENVGDEETTRANFVPDVVFYDSTGDRDRDGMREAVATRGDPFPPNGQVDYELRFGIDDDIAIGRYEVSIECPDDPPGPNPYC